jgi:hypothetical protein
MTGAWAFVCDDIRSTDVLVKKLNELGGWQWWLGDSYWYGDYVACKPFPGVRIRIIDFPTIAHGGYRYESDVRIGKECTTSMEEIDAAYRKVLEQLGAHDVEEIESFD